jgi:hypothetical protein
LLGSKGSGQSRVARPNNNNVIIWSSHRRSSF